MGRTLAGANVSDRREEWVKNYRVPDVLVFMNDCESEDCHTHWLGGPDLAIEIVSEGDRTLDKLEFYAAVNTKELLVVDRHPWPLTLYRRANATTMSPVAVSSFSLDVTILSDHVPVQFRLAADPARLCVRTKSGDLVREISIST